MIDEYLKPRHTDEIIMEAFKNNEIKIDDYSFIIKTANPHSFLYGEVEGDFGACVIRHGELLQLQKEILVDTFGTNFVFLDKNKHKRYYPHNLLATPILPSNKDIIFDFSQVDNQELTDKILKNKIDLTNVKNSKVYICSCSDDLGFLGFGPVIGELSLKVFPLIEYNEKLLKENKAIYNGYISLTSVLNKEDNTKSIILAIKHKSDGLTESIFQYNIINMYKYPAPVRFAIKEEIMG